MTFFLVFFLGYSKNSSPHLWRTGVTYQTPCEIMKNNQQMRRNFNGTFLLAHTKNFLNYWYGNCPPFNFPAFLYTLDMEGKGILHIKSSTVSMICACVTLVTSEIGNNLVSMIFRGCDVCRLSDVQYFSEWINVSEYYCTVPWCAAVCSACGTRMLCHQKASFDVNGTILLHQYCLSESS